MCAGWVARFYPTKGVVTTETAACTGFAAATCHGLHADGNGNVGIREVRGPIGERLATGMERMQHPLIGARTGSTR